MLDASPAIAKYLTVLPSAHRALLELVTNQIADGDDSEALTDMRALLEQLEVADVTLAKIIEMGAQR